jgi:phage tail tube protein FII
MPVEGDAIPETSKDQNSGSLLVPGTPKSKTKMGMEDNGMLEIAFNTLLLQQSQQTMDTEVLVILFASNLHSHSPCTTNSVQHAISNIISDVDEGHFDQCYRPPTQVSTSSTYSPHTTSNFYPILKP